MHLPPAYKIGVPTPQHMGMIERRWQHFARFAEYIKTETDVALVGSTLWLMASACAIQEHPATHSPRSSKSAQKRQYLRWTEQEKRNLIARREEASSWNELQEKYYSDYTIRTLQTYYSQFVKEFDMSATTQAKQPAVADILNTTPSKRGREDEEDTSSSSDSSGGNISFSGKKLRVSELTGSRVSGRLSSSLWDKQNKPLQIGITPDKPLQGKNVAETEVAPVQDTSPKAQAGTDSGSATATDSARSHTIQADTGNLFLIVTGAPRSARSSHELSQSKGAAHEAIEQLYHAASGISSLEEKNLHLSIELQTAHETIKSLQAENETLKSKWRATQKLVWEAVKE